MAGVMWDLEQEKAGIVYYKLNKYKNEIKTVNDMLNKTATLKPNDPKEPIIPTATACSIFSKHGFNIADCN